MFDHESTSEFDYASFCWKEWRFNHEKEDKYINKLFDHESEQFRWDT